MGAFAAEPAGRPRAEPAPARVPARRSRSRTCRRATATPPPPRSSALADFDAFPRDILWFSGICAAGRGLRAARGRRARGRAVRDPAAVPAPPRDRRHGLAASAPASATSACWRPRGRSGTRAEAHFEAAIAANAAAGIVSMERMTRDDLIALLEARGESERAEALRGEALDRPTTEQVSAGLTASPARIVPSLSTSARRPPMCTSARSVPGSVSRSRCAHGSHRRWPKHSTSPTVKRRPTSALRSIPRVITLRRALTASLDEAGVDQRQVVAARVRVREGAAAVEVAVALAGRGPRVRRPPRRRAAALRRRPRARAPRPGPRRPRPARGGVHRATSAGAIT